MFRGQVTHPFPDTRPYLCLTLGHSAEPGSDHTHPTDLWTWPSEAQKLLGYQSQVGLNPPTPSTVQPTTSCPCWLVNQGTLHG